MLGGVIIEKHFTYDKTLPGDDHYHAMDKDDLQLFRVNLDIPKGKIIEESNLMFKRMEYDI